MEEYKIDVGCTIKIVNLYTGNPFFPAGPVVPWQGPKTKRNQFESQQKASLHGFVEFKSKGPSRRSVQLLVII